MFYIYCISGFINSTPKLNLQLFLENAGPGLSNVRPHQIIFHPATGLCIVRKSIVKPLQLGSCTESDEWTYTPQKMLAVKGTYFCLQADGVGKPAKLGIICSGSNSKWEMISDSKMHLSSKLLDGTTVCLDVDSGNNVVTNLCSCLNVDRTCDPGSQWFKIVNSTRSSSGEKVPLPGETIADLVPEEHEGRSSQ